MAGPAEIGYCKALAGRTDDAHLLVVLIGSSGAASSVGGGGLAVGLHIDRLLGSVGVEDDAHITRTDKETS